MEKSGRYGAELSQLEGGIEITNYSPIIRQLAANNIHENRSENSAASCRTKLVIFSSFGIFIKIVCTVNNREKSKISFED